MKQPPNKTNHAFVTSTRNYSNTEVLGLNDKHSAIVPTKSFQDLDTRSKERLQHKIGY